jgi:hypothetical protein
MNCKDCANFNTLTQFCDIDHINCVTCPCEDEEGDCVCPKWAQPDRAKNCFEPISEEEVDD